MGSMGPAVINPEHDYTIAIVGGGIGGLCTAVGLLHQGIKVEIYEATAAFSEIGAGVSLGPNAAHAIQMIDPRAYDGFRKIRTVNAWPSREHFWFTFRTGDDCNGPKFGTPFHDQYCETGQSSVHRARFLEELVALLPDDIAHFGKKLAHIDNNADHVVLHFQDGTTGTHSAVIGCDGVKSRTREVLFGKDDPSTAPTFSGKYAYRGLVPMSRASCILGDELSRNSQMYLGHGGHILTFPIENGQTMNVVAFGTKEDNTWDEKHWIKPVNREAMFKDFEGWIEPCQQILGLMQKSDTWALYDHPPAPTYFKNRICLLGDAAHASTPHNGAGAGQAIEDAFIMAQTLRHVNDNNDVPLAFSIFDKLRRPRSQKQVSDARQMGLIYDMQAEGIGDDLNKIREEITGSKKWLWEWDLNADAREAERLFKEGKGIPC